MKSYKDVCEKWFGSEDNIVIIHEEESGKLIFGIEDESIAIAYVMNIFDNYEISIDKRVNVGKYAYRLGEQKFVLNTEEELYKLLFNLLLVMKKRDIKLNVDERSLADMLIDVRNECDMEFMKNILDLVVRRCLNK